MKLIVAASIAVMLLWAPIENSGLDAECSPALHWLGLCVSVTPTVGPTDFSLGASETVPPLSAASTPGDPTAQNPAAGRSLDPCLRDCYTVTGPHSVSDFAAFTPVPAVDHMQPNGWMVIGISTNFYAVVDEPQQEGTLLGAPVSVRFVPSGYDWDYGDGTTATRTTKGATWAAQGITDFDPTPTSHIFRTRGNYTIHLTVDFRIQYSLDSGDWIWATGELHLPANPLTATAGTAKTVLVSADCLTNPAGPGC